MPYILYLFKKLYFAENLLKKVITILLSCICCINAGAQQGIAFQHLNTSNGLSYSGVSDMCVDQKGNVWIATGNGLNMFNGKTVDKYFVEEYPQLHSNNIIHVTCDRGNRIWILTADGHVSMLDEKRQVHQLGLYNKNEPAKTAWILNSQGGGIILWTRNGHYSYNANTSLAPNDTLSEKNLIPFSLKGFDTLKSKSFRFVHYYDDDNYLYVTEEAFFKVNYRTKEVEGKYDIRHCTPLVKWANNSLLFFDRETKEVKAVDLATKEITYPFKGLKDQSGKDVSAVFYFAEKISAEKYLLTSFSEGIFIYDASTKKIYRYTHSLSDPASISNNTQSTIAVSRMGWVFISCNPNGISYFNTNDFIGNQNVFTDNKGNGFDGYIAGIATKDNNKYYIGTAEGILEWKRNINKTTFINFPGKNGEPLIKKEDVSSIVIDGDDRIWFTTLSQGVFIIDRNLGLLKNIKYGNNDKYAIKLKRVVYLLTGPDNFIWACGSNGICRIDPKNFEVDNLENTPLVKLDSVHCTPILFTDKDNLWVATAGKGVYHYNLLTQQLDNYTRETGLSSNGIFCINADNEKNIYIGSRLGLNILYTNGRIKTITQKDGLLIDRAEGFLLDKHDRMWIGNDIGLACYNTKDSNLVTFDERYGLSIYGFRVGSYFQMPNGEFVFGTPRGIQYFHPDSLYNKKIFLNALINKIETKSIVSNITETSTFNLPASDNQVTFYFSSVDFTPHLRTYYEYQLEGIDKGWIKLADQNAVRYNSLPAGKFIFKVRISNDNKNWQDAENQVTIVIATPVYKTWWFRLLATLTGMLIMAYVFNYYRKQQIEKRNNLETELVITYFASQINSHNNIDDLLWDVAKNCISKLHFEDCVIYLKDEARNVLIQKAAYGPKNPLDYTIHQPIEIPVGKGISGTVAQTGKPEIINNTGEDARYIVDDKRRNAEIAVPILSNNKVIGVIDSEHKQRGFFTQKHLGILQTIAVLCANQIQKTKAEEEKQKATIELLENKQKAMESRLQSLRLQMNPHFLFNALNSIQQMILANEEMVATRYLSRFSKLLRTVLLHSDKESITLKEEIDILKMYVELESVRFKESFTYVISCDEDIETEEIKIPTLLIQPFVENAIWHGLMHKEGDRKLSVSFKEKADFLQCIIEDNGVGRKKAMEMKISTGQDKKHTGKGISVSEERLKTLKTADGKHGNIEIIDMVDTTGEPMGTQVIINFPIQNK